MKRLLVVLFFFMTAVVALPAPPQNTFSPDQIKFGPVPPVLRRERSWQYSKAIRWDHRETTPFA